MKLRKTLAVSAAAFFLLAGCSSDDDSSAPDGATTDVPVDGTPDTDAADPGDDGSTDDAPDDDAPDAAPSGVGDGTLVMGDETIELGEARCYLEEQDAAAGGGKILYTGQAAGFNGDGEQVFIDVSRYDEDSTFAGDSIDLVIGDYTTDDSTSYGIMPGESLDVITVDGSTISADDVELVPDDMDGNVMVSFELNC